MLLILDAAGAGDRGCVDVVAAMVRAMVRAVMGLLLVAVMSGLPSVGLMIPVVMAMVSITPVMCARGLRADS